MAAAAVGVAVEAARYAGVAAAEGTCAYAPAEEAAADEAVARGAAGRADFAGSSAERKTGAAPPGTGVSAGEAGEAGEMGEAGAADEVGGIGEGAVGTDIEGEDVAEVVVHVPY